MPHLFSSVAVVYDALSFLASCRIMVSASAFMALFSRPLPRMFSHKDLIDITILHELAGSFIIL